MINFQCIRPSAIVYFQKCSAQRAHIAHRKYHTCAVRRIPSTVSRVKQRVFEKRQRARPTGTERALCAVGYAAEPFATNLCTCMHTLHTPPAACQRHVAVRGERGTSSAVDDSDEIRPEKLCSLT
ncbi:hypothetical protein EVAR_67280_1 [Eumeta japonica]|uniref:Uncharacterized protein n=1 Tax=Eumeta variegata TaxID=151549 RepID=A0A4C1ZT57_EUMVA|nr:hypothetical protein EVAR_67280_1 [Eumeta japonica]